MKISDLKPGMRKVDIEGTIVELQTPREVNTKFGPGQVVTAKLHDETGSVILTLWNELVSKVSMNDGVRIENGYVDSYRGELQLNVGRYGKLSFTARKS